MKGGWDCNGYAFIYLLRGFGLFTASEDIFFAWKFSMLGIGSQQMEVMQILIDQIVTDISAQAGKLDEVRLRMFLRWLKIHSRKGAGSSQIYMDYTEGINGYFKLTLKRWVESLPIPGLLWEYHLILNEIDWWQRLDDRFLCKILVAISRKKKD